MTYQMIFPQLGCKEQPKLEAYNQTFMESILKAIPLKFEDLKKSEFVKENLTFLLKEECQICKKIRDKFKQLEDLSAEQFSTLSCSLTNFFLKLKDIKKGL